MATNDSRYDTSDQEMFVQRGGNRVINPVHFGDKQVNLERQQQAEGFLEQIYAMPIELQTVVADQIIRDNAELAPILWYSATKTGHVKIAKAVKDSGKLALNQALNFDDPVSAYKKTMREGLFSTKPEEKAAALETWLREFRPEEMDDLMYHAAGKGDSVLIKLLLEQGVEANSSVPTLHAACNNGHLECTELLIACGWDVNVRDQHGGTPLMRAAVVLMIRSMYAVIDAANIFQGNQVEVVRWLLENGAIGDLRETRQGNYNALEYTAGRSAEIARLLLPSCGFSITALMAAASFRNEESFKMLLEAGNFPPVPDGSTNDEFWNNTLSEEQREAIVKSIDRAGSGDPDQPLTILKQLLEYVPKSQIKNHDDIKTALENCIRRAVVSNCVQTIRLILPILTDEVWSVDEKPNKVNDFLSEAACRNAQKTAKFLLEEYGADVNFLDDSHQTTPLYYAASRGYTEMVKFLVKDYSADIHIGSGKFANGPTALGIAIANQHEDVVRVLLENGGPVEQVDIEIKHGKTTRLFVDVARAYRYPVRLLERMDPMWEADECNQAFLCLEYPDGLPEKVWPRRPDAELKDKREMRKEEDEGFVFV